MAWLFSCFRCNWTRQSGPSSPEKECKKAVENAVVMRASVLETQAVLAQDERMRVNNCSEKSLDVSKQGNDLDRSLSLFFKTENRCYLPQKQPSNQPLQVVELQKPIIEETKKRKNLKAEANDLQNNAGGLPDSPDNFKKAFNNLHADAEEGTNEEGRHMACLQPLPTKFEHEDETLIQCLMFQEQNRSDCKGRVDMRGPILSSTKPGVHLSDIEDPKEMHEYSSSPSPATQEDSESSFKEKNNKMGGDISLLERPSYHWRGCSSESKAKQLSSRKDDLSNFLLQDTDQPLVMARSKRSSRALSFSELALLEAAACSKFTSEQLEPEDLRSTERQTIGVTTLRGEIDDEKSKTLFAVVSESLPASGDQAISMTVSQGTLLYDTDMEVDSKAAKPYSNESHFISDCRTCRWVQIPTYGGAQELLSRSDLTMEQSQVFTFEESYDGFSDALSQLSVECSSKRNIVDEELASDQMSHCSHTTSFPTSPLLHTPSNKDKVSVKQRGHLQATARSTVKLQENGGESSAECRESKYHPELSAASTETSGRWVTQASHQQSWDVDSFEETNSRDINLCGGGMEQLSANTADLSSRDQLLLDEATSKQDVAPCSRFMNVSPESSICSSRDHGKATCKQFPLLEATSPVSVSSLETLTYERSMQSPLPHNIGAREEPPTPHKIMLNSPPEMPAVSNLTQPVPESSNKSFLKQQLTPRTPSVSSLQVETPNSVQSTVSPADLAKDRPILGTVAAHWSHSSSTEKWWDGKGIPNSTNKYKEDQKVSWHATPFEVRLERALAKQGRVFQNSRKLFGGAMATEQMELRTEPITSSG